MSRWVGLAACVALLAAAPPAGADAVSDALGQTYAKASPPERLVLLAEARTDKVLEPGDVAAAIGEIFRTAVAAGKTPRERLKRLGALRNATTGLLKELNAVRKEERKRYVSAPEPEEAFQLAVALEFVRTAAGARPTLEELACLAHVRRATTRGATGKLVLALVHDALTRHEAFVAGDCAAKLKIIRAQAEERELFSDHERTVIENMVLTEWLTGRLAEGAAPDEVAAELEQLRERKDVCFFSYRWAKATLAEIAALRGRASESSE